MGRKKKKEEPEICHTSFGSTVIPPYPEIDLSPYTIETTSLSDNTRRFITTTHPGTSITYSTTIGYEDFMRQIGKEEEAKVKVNVEHFKGKYVCCVTDGYDLLQERILMTLSAVKGRLMMEVMAPVCVKEFQCSMTPMVRQNIIQASKRIRMYGKKLPIIARFDDYGNRLPDKINIDTLEGMTLKIVDPKEYGELYLELTAIEFSKNDFNFSIDENDLPF